MSLSLDYILPLRLTNEPIMNLCLFLQNVSHHSRWDGENQTLVVDGQTEYKWLHYTLIDIDGTTKMGKKFEIPQNILDSLNLAWKGPFIKLDEDSVRDFIFVTAASENHFEESKGAVALVQKLLPNHTVLYYDIGLRSDQRQKVSLSRYYAWFLLFKISSLICKSLNLPEIVLYKRKSTF